jgi:hypothetical protein
MHTRFIPQFGKQLLQWELARIRRLLQRRERLHGVRA